MTKALLIIDPQNDFCEGGSLAVPDSNKIFPCINQFRQKYPFDFVFITQDWHPENHISFAKNHGLHPFTTKQINNQQYMLWPVHCVQNTHGANLSNLLNVQNEDIFVKKGIIQNEQQYSGFGTAKCPTELKYLLQKFNVDEVFVVGLALDYCVGNTALDARKANFTVTVVKQCTKGVSLETSQKMIQRLAQNGISYQSLSQIVKAG